MRRFTMLLAVVVVLGSVIALARWPVAAQDATPASLTAMATHPVVGLWRTAVANEGGTPFTSLSTFHADGTYTEVLPDGTVSSGVWQPSGERTADLTFYVFFSIGDRLVQGEGRITVAVDASGNRLTEEGTLVGRYDDGSVAIAIESPATGARMQVLPVEPLGTPVLPLDMAAAGTPAP